MANDSVTKVWLKKQLGNLKKRNLVEFLVFDVFICGFIVSIVSSRLESVLFPDKTNTAELFTAITENILDFKIDALKIYIDLSLENTFVLASVIISCILLLLLMFVKGKEGVVRTFTSIVAYFIVLPTLYVNITVNNLYNSLYIISSVENTTVPIINILPTDPPTFNPTIYVTCECNNCTSTPEPKVTISPTPTARITTHPTVTPTLTVSPPPTKSVRQIEMPNFIHHKAKEAATVADSLGIGLYVWAEGLPEGTSIHDYGDKWYMWEVISQSPSAGSMIAITDSAEITIRYNGN